MNRPASPVIKHRVYTYRVSIKVAESDKHKMLETRNALQAQAQAAHGTPTATYHTSASASTSTGIPTLKHIGHDDDAEADADGWITFDKPFNYFYAGKGPFVSQDLMQFPVSHPDDGLIDVVISERVRTE